MLAELKRQVKDSLSEALDETGYTADLSLENPPEDVDADVASSVAFEAAGRAESDIAPPEVAAELAESVDVDAHALIGESFSQGPYVNFVGGKEYLSKTLEEAQENGYPSASIEEKNEKILLEHTSANPTGPLHVGRARNPIIGDSLARLLRAAGYDVEVEYYINDMGRQVATVTWALEEFDEDELPDMEGGREKGDHDVVRYYRRANDVVEGKHGKETAEHAKDEIDDLLQALEEGDEKALGLVEKAVDRCLDGQLESLERLGATYDGFVRESEFVLDGTVDEVAERLRQDERCYEEQDAYAVDLSDHGIGKELVFLRSDGTSLYTTRDIAYHLDKFERSDRAINVLGEDHKLQAEQLKAALNVLGVEESAESIFYSYVNLPEGKMSTRAGGVIDMDDLLDEAIGRARAEIEERKGKRDREVEVGDKTARAVGIGAVRYDILARQPEKPITFRWEEALNFDGQHAPYIQYVGARASGILENAESEPNADISALDAPEERNLIRKIAELSAVIEDSAEGLCPHKLATYSRELAESFNEFYRECPVVGAPNEAERVAVVQASRVAIENSLRTVGIETPEAM